MSTKNSLGQFLYRFAVVSDAHIAETESSDCSPFEVNQLASARYRHVVKRLQGFDVDFVLNLGDMVHPLPSSPLYSQAAQRFHTLTEPLAHPLYTIPGNHDVGDKPSQWMPAEPVDEVAVETYRQHFGPDYQLFVHKEHVFILLNAQLLNCAIAAQQSQQQWLLEALQNHRGKRMFLAMHYPPYVCHAQEIDHYDNIAEPARSWLLGLLQKYQIEAVFSGHVHNVWFNRYADTDLYILPAISFTRQDYAEMYAGISTDSDWQGGRNDRAKLGFYTFDVYEHDHIWHMHRSFGATQSADQGSTAEGFTDEGATNEGLADSTEAQRISAAVMSAARQSVPSTMLHPLEVRHSNFASLGLDMRHPWLQVHEIAPSGALDEFYRKQARNDYPLLAICEMGVRDVRVPLSDIISTTSRQRLRVLQRMGLRFCSYCFGLPDKNTLALLTEHHSLLDSLQIIWPQNNNSAAALDQLVALRETCKIPLLISPLWQEHGHKDAQGRHYHMINHGFDERHDVPSLQSFLQSGSATPPIDGVVFRLTVDETFATRLEKLAANVKQLGCRAHVLARLTDNNPAAALTDEMQIALRAAIASVCANGSVNNLRFYLDTFVEVDRGYCRRAGLVDRLYNPSAGWHVLRAVRRYKLRNMIAGNVLALIDSNHTKRCLLTLACSANPVAAANLAWLSAGILEVTPLYPNAGDKLQMEAAAATDYINHSGGFFLLSAPKSVAVASK